MKRIYFHADVDGIVSAAIYLDAVKAQDKMQYAMYPLFSSMRGGKFASLVDHTADNNDEVIILDFTYHKKASLWIDHHSNPMFRKSMSGKLWFDENASSAASVVAKWAKSMRYDNPLVDSITPNVDMIDAAKYPSIEYIFTNESPLMLIRAHLDTSFPSETMYCRIVEVLALCHLDVDLAIKVLRIEKLGLQKLNDHVKEAKSHVIKFDNMTLLRQRFPYQFARYVENMVVPGASYNVRISKSLEKGLLYFQAGYNKWSGYKNPLNLGMFIGNHRLIIKGGGHFNVGSGMIKSENVEEMLDDFSSIIAREDTVEKYGVDKEDKVEKKAEELVKTAAAKDMPDAREKAVKQIEKEEKGDAQQL